MADFDLYQQQIAQQQRRQQFAQMLMQQGMQQEPTQMAGNIAIRQSPFSALAKGLATYKGIQGINDTDKAIGDLSMQKDQADRAALAEGMRLFQAGDRQGAMAAFAGTPKGQSYAAALMGSQLEKAPDKQREFEYRNTLDPAGQAAFDKFLQSGQTPFSTPIQTSTGFQSYNNRTGDVTPLMGAGGQPLMPVPADPSVKGAVAKAEAIGTATGKGQADAAMDQPRIDANADMTIGVLDALKNHPGRQYATGLYSLAPTIPGTKQADFRAYLDQLNGQTFLQAYQNLKGGGQITEIEGKKATDAIQRVKAAQTDAEFDKGIDDLKELLKSAQSVNRKKAGLLTSTAAPSTGAPQAPGATVPAGGRFQIEVVQ